MASQRDSDGLMENIWRFLRLFTDQYISCLPILNCRKGRVFALRVNLSHILLGIWQIFC